MANFVAFYWTLPVFSAGFRSLPVDGAKAANRSKTIRHQRNAVSAYVASERGALVHEIAYLSERADGITGKIVGPRLRKAVRLCQREEATFITIASYPYFWRPNFHLKEFIHQSGVRSEFVPADFNPIDGFDPAEHFRTWRAYEENWRAQRREKPFDHELEAQLKKIPRGRGQNQKIADALNEIGSRSANGKAWTADIVRHRVRKLGDEISHPDQIES